MNESFELLGAEFDSQLNRHDGQLVARQLWHDWQQDVKNWLDDLMYPLIGSLRLSSFGPELTEKEHLDRDIQCRRELYCFQAIETALFAQRYRYITSNNFEWFVQWCLRLRIGSSISDAVKHRVPLFTNKDPESKLVILTGIMWTAFSMRARAHFFFEAFSPLIFTATHRTTAAAFQDDTTKAQIESEHKRVDLRLSEVVPLVISGGGSVFVMEDAKGIPLPRSPKYGQLFHVWTKKEFADRFCEAAGSGFHSSVMDYRELLVQLQEFKQNGMQFVVIDRDANEPALQTLPIADVIEMTGENVATVDASPMGKKFLKMRGDERSGL